MYQRELSSQLGARQYRTELVAFGDPSFEGISFPTDSVRGTGDLPFSRREVEAVARIVVPDRIGTPCPSFVEADGVTIRMGAFSTKAAIKEVTSDASCRYFHIATHGLSDVANPELSGLVFSRSLEGDSLWSMQEILGAHIATELVVLSACQSAVGKVLRGEGVIGLTRAFAHAGAASVCASLWNVSDESTYWMMQSLYSHLRQSASKGEALQRAQLTVLGMSQFDHPYFWAPFVMAAGR